jgi:hypothetical protein
MVLAKKVGFIGVACTRVARFSFAHKTKNIPKLARKLKMSTAAKSPRVTPNV